MEWLKTVNWESTDAYYMPKNTVYGGTKENVVNAYNYILMNNGYFDPKVVDYRYNCNVMAGWSIARIIKTFEGSNVVQIEFKSPYSSRINKKYVVLNMITPMNEYRHAIAR